MRGKRKKKEVNTDLLLDTHRPLIQISQFPYIYKFFWNYKQNTLTATVNNKKKNKQT